MNRYPSFKIFLMALPALAALLLSGCVKEEDLRGGRRPGDPIAFGFAPQEDMVVEDDPGTRTEYSGLLFGESPKYERIDWTPGTDQIRILCTAAPDGPTADYAIVEVETPTTQVSTAAAIVPLSGYGMHWGTGNHYFYAMYPVPGMKQNYPSSSSPWTAANAAITDAGSNKAKVSGKIPSSQEVHFIDATTSGKGFHEYKPNMNYAYMSAAQYISSGSVGSDVELHFTPLVTTFEFTLVTLAGSALPSGNLTKVELTSEYDTLSGSFETIVSQDNTHTTPASQSDWDNTVSLDLGTGIELSETPVKFTLFTLPVEQSHLTLVLWFGAGANEFKRTLELKNNGSWLDVGACKKLYVSNLRVPGVTLDYELVHTGTTITLADADNTVVEEALLSTKSAGTTSEAPFRSYKTYMNRLGVTVQTPVDISTTYEYALADRDGNPEVNGSNQIVWRSGLPSGVGLTSFASTVDKDLQASISANSTAETVYELIEHARNLKSKPQAVNKDLAYYPCDDLDTPREYPITANCYVVDRPGSYRFPIVYGNAIDYETPIRYKSGAAFNRYKKGANRYAYFDGDGVSASTNTQWHVFQRYDGNHIDSPFILSDLGLSTSDVEAVVVWEDVPSSTYSFIQGVSVTTVSSTQVFYDTKTGSEGYLTEVPYIQFTIPQGNIDETTAGLPPTQRVTGIRQGNALIALRLKTSPRTILWSWHIWVTDGWDTDGDQKGDGLTPVRFPSSSHLSPSYLMPVNLGWCDLNTYASYDRVWYVRIRQDEGKGTPKQLVFKVSQKPPRELDTSTLGSSCTLYEWGRKDPLIPSAGFSYWYQSKAAYSPSNYTLFSDTGHNALSNSSSPAANASSSIQNPHIYYVKQATTDKNVWSWMDNQYPRNLWNMTAVDPSTINDVTHTIDYTTYKTVYDPCPPGYSLPQNLAFSSFLTNGYREMHLWAPATEGYDTAYFNALDYNGDGAINKDSESNDYFPAGGWYVYTDDTKTSTIFFPGTGYREPTTGSAYFANINGTTGGYLWLPCLAYWNKSPQEIVCYDGYVAMARINEGELSPMCRYTNLCLGFAVRAARQ